MVDAVDKLMTELRSACAKEQIVRSHHVIYAQEAIAALRAELEQVKRELEQTKEVYLRAWNERDAQRRRAEAAERLAGARVKGVEAAREALGELANVKMDLALDEWCRISNTILSALSEPAGEAEPILDQDKVDGWSSTKLALWKVVIDENMNDGHYINAYRFTEKLYEAVTTPPASAIREAEPCQFLPTEDGEFNGNTFSDEPVPFGWITHSAYDRISNSSLPEKVTVIRNAAGPTDMPRVALYTTPPDASVTDLAEIERQDNTAHEVDKGVVNKAAEGRQAYRNGLTRDQNPYPHGTARYWQWSSGWLDERAFRPK